MQLLRENESLVTEFVLTGCSGLLKSKMEIVVILIIAYSVTVIGNGLIILIIICEPRLHNPMYFFICNLSVVDFCYSTTCIPQSIAYCLVDRPVMSSFMCFVQSIFGTVFAATECLFLVVMAYDRYVAIANPLHYIFIMNKTVCILLATSTWTSAFVLIIGPFFSFRLRFCGQNIIDHLLCEPKAIFKLVCEDFDVYQIAIFVIGICFLVLPLGFIVSSYVRIIIAIQRMHAEGSRMKAFQTCSSHLLVVTMFFGTAMSSYLIPQSKETRLHDKITSAIYIIITPMFNPLIYTLRNKEILEALKRMTYRKRDV